MVGARKGNYLDGHFWFKIMHTITAHDVKVAEYSLNQTKKCYEYSSDFVGVYTALMTSQILYFKGFQGHKKGQICCLYYRNSKLTLVEAI